MILMHTFPVALTQSEVTINQDMKGITPFKCTNPEYLAIVLKSLQSKILGYIKEATHGTLRLEMPLIQTIAIPLPSLAEQHEIVHQVNKLFSLADKLDLHYQKAKSRTDKLSQSVLAKAFRGELVPQDPNDEPAEKLLARIREEKEKMAAQMKTRKLKNGKK
jgi:type I restriction enzyme S subunit